ncbi:MAG: single-stranded-DNA-specific exonuclease RecJ [Bacillota bacterium]|nr:single-stranded-DNA-specific exonuclease RecJ [Bacillota bacterium]MDW7676977.1 single-stranded-DNA-specific exonuclease RecJ [Bacillota bacterium]
MTHSYKTYWQKIQPLSDVKLPGHYDPLIEKILASRGMTDYEQMSEFLSDRPQLTYDPFLLKGMMEAVNRITEALDKQEKIVFYGDYDVDGITSVALLIDFFFPLTQKIEFYIPLRQEEGYGLNRDALLEIREDYQADLVITVDCGISALEEISYARSIGLDMIITDHHTPGEQLPKAIIINPKQPGCAYPFKELSGCGVAFKLAQALQQQMELPKSQLTELLDLVALATVCDVVPLQNENRTLLKYGLKRIRRTERCGLLALISALSLKKDQIGVRDLGFVIGPHFNASGRIDDARKGVQLLVTKNPQTAKSIAERLKLLNLERRDIQEAGLEQCHHLVKDRYPKDPFLVVEGDDLHEGVIGIIAGRLRDSYYRPTIVLTPSQEPGIYTGSGRSVEGFHLFNELQPVASLMERFGGHANACGLKIKKENIHNLREYLGERVLNMEEHSPDLLCKKIRIVEDLTPLDVSESLVMEIMRLEPYGMGNEKPYFRMKNIVTDQNSMIRTMGAVGQHLKVCGFLQDDQPEEQGIEILGFGVDEQVKHLMLSLKPFDLVFYPQINEFRGKKCVQLMIKDVKPTE